MTPGRSASALRVLLGVPWYFPDSVGGTEVYVRGLARGLRESGVEVGIAAPSRSGRSETYRHDGVSVFRYPAPDGASGEIDRHRMEPKAWCDLLEAFAPAVVDLHALTSGLELAHLKAARRRGAHTVCTLHIPGVVCARGTFMRFGHTPCSGDIAREPCTACRLQAQGIPETVGRLLSSVPQPIADALAVGPLPGIARRALTARHRDLERQAWLGDIVRYVDRLVVPSAWFVDVLLRNGVPADKVVLCRQGVDIGHTIGAARTEAIGLGGTALKVGFVGRFDPVKGLHVLIDAMKSLPADLEVVTHVWGVARSDAERAYRQAMIDRANGSRRVVFHDETSDPASVYKEIHVLAVPSEWLETGPLVVLEAQAAGLPVVGSNLGGIAERITDGEDGILVPFGDAAALGRVLTELARNPARLQALRRGRAPRTVDDVVRETLGTYETIAARHAA